MISETLGANERPIESWIALATDVLRLRGTGRTRELYAESGKLPHFRELSSRILQQVGERDLAKAAFLHGVDPDDLSLLRSIWDVTDDVVAILDDRARLRSIGEWGEKNPATLTEADGPELSRRLVGNVLPQIRDARAVVLFVVEQLAELDDRQVLSEWTMAFPRNPTHLPAGFALATPRDRFVNSAARTAFLRYVVATTARFFGMWQERNIAENLALLHGNPDRFFRVLDFVIRDSEAHGRAAVLTRMIADRLPSAVHREVRWEWHHLAAIEREIGSDLKDETWAKRFDRTGFVVVDCVDKESCYDVLRLLHSAFEYIPAATRDKIGQPESSGYSALHTTLVRRDSRADQQELVPVHVVLESASRSSEIVDAVQLDRIWKRTRAEETATIRVFAPDGRAYDIPPGSLVMNLAHAVHRDLLPRLRGATVNRRYVHPNAMLEDGDVVWLDLADTPQQLVEEWFEQLPESTRARLRRDYVESSKPVLVAAGRRWLRKRIDATGCIDQLDDRQIDEMLEDVKLVALSPEIRDVRGLLRQIGLLDAHERGEPLIREPLIDRPAAESVADALVARILKSLRLASEMDVPSTLRDAATRAEACSQCVPRATEDLAGELVDDVLILHRAFANCAAGATPIASVPRAIARQYFVIETTSRVGVACDVLDVFKRHQVDIEEISGRRLASGWGVIRVVVDFVSLPRQLAIAEELRRVAGGRVVMPYDDPIPLLESRLPKRSSVASPLWKVIEPYHVGAGLEDDRLFYGMSDQLSTLEKTYIAVTDPGGRVGKFAWISGPLRTGKSSVALQFLRRHERDALTPIVAYVTASPTPWSGLATRITDALRVEVESLGLAVPEAPLGDVIIQLKRSTKAPIIIVIDEVTGMLLQTNKNDAEAAAIEAFYRAVSGAAGVFVVWVGPDAPVRDLRPQLINMLQAAVPVEIGQLTPGEVAQLLRAEKLRPMYAIHLDAGVAEGVHRLTGGNPCWVNQLAVRMSRYAGGGTEKTFTLKNVDDAKESFLQRKLWLSDRLPQTESELRVVLALLQQTENNSRGVHRDELFATLSEHLSPGDFDRALTDLTLAGTLVSDRGRCRIAAPLLHDFLIDAYGQGGRK